MAASQLKLLSLAKHLFTGAFWWNEPDKTDMVWKKWERSAFFSSMISYVWAGGKKGGRRQRNGNMRWWTMCTMGNSELAADLHGKWEQTSLLPILEEALMRNHWLKTPGIASFPIYPAMQTPFIKSPRKPHLCLVAPILGREALARLVILNCSNVLYVCKTHTHIKHAWLC